MPVARRKSLGVEKWLIAACVSPGPPSIASTEDSEGSAHLLYLVTLHVESVVNKNKNACRGRHLSGRRTFVEVYISSNNTRCDAVLKCKMGPIAPKVVSPLHQRGLGRRGCAIVWRTGILRGAPFAGRPEILTGRVFRAREIHRNLGAHGVNDAAGRPTDSCGRSLSGAIQTRYEYGPVSPEPPDFEHTSNPHCNSNRNFTCNFSCHLAVFLLVILLVIILVNLRVIFICALSFICSCIVTRNFTCNFRLLALAIFLAILLSILLVILVVIFSCNFLVILLVISHVIMYLVVLALLLLSLRVIYLLFYLYFHYNFTCNFTCNFLAIFVHVISHVILPPICTVNFT